MNGTTMTSTFCMQHQPFNPYCGVFGLPEVVEVVFLSIFSFLGTFGNLLVICSIIYAKRAFKHGNIFIINLAAADLIVCGFFLPTVIANVIKTDNALPLPACYFAGYLATVTCACSVCSLAFIALNRYWSVAHSLSYAKVFNPRNSSLMVGFTWLWSNFITSPTLFGWSKLIYDYKMAECGWDDQTSIVYNVLLMVCAIFLPVTVITFCYWNLFKSVREIRVKRIAQSSITSSNILLESLTQEKNQLRMKKEIALLKTLAVCIIAFLISWIPYGVVVVFFSHTVPPHVKKAVARLGLSNSAVNFVIYGVMNPVYRKGYRNFIQKFLCCFKTLYCKWLMDTSQTPKKSNTSPFTPVQKSKNQVSTNKENK